MRITKQNAPLWIIFLTVFIDLVGFGILIPVIPQLLANPASPYYLLPPGMTYQQGFILLGLLIAVYPIMQFIAAPILGQLSDKYGRKPILIVSLFGTCISYIVFAIGIITHNLPLLFLARGLDGITGGNISVAQAVIADITPPQDRAKNFGLLGAAFGLGFILGPYIGGKLSDPNISHFFTAATPFFFAALLSGINTMLVFLILPETHLSPDREKPLELHQSFTNIAKAFSYQHMKLLFTTSFLIQAGFSFFTTFFSVLLIQQLHFTQSNIGDFFAYVGLWVAFTQAFLTRRVNSRFEEYKILRIAIIATGLSLFLYLFPTHWWQLLLIVPVFAIANGLTQANLLGLISRSADSSVQGEILGINASVQALAQAIPPILSGFIAAELTVRAPIVTAGIFIVVAGIVFWVGYKSKQSPLSSDEQTQSIPL